MVHTRVHPWPRLALLCSLCGILLGLFTGLGYADAGQAPAPASVEGVPGSATHRPVRPADTYTGLTIDVRDFGAKGDGRTDDTAAIRAAIKAAHERRRIPQHPKYGYFTSFAEVYFPNGHYLISDTIDINAVKLRGENYAAIEQTNPEKDIFHTPNAWRQLIEGLTFLGGKVQLNLNNPNVDTGHVTVRDCHFYNSADVAVRVKVVSTFVKVENCVFVNCEQAIFISTDLSVVRDLWISTSPRMKNKAAIVNGGGCMHIENLLGVPRVSRGPVEWARLDGLKRIASDQRWIDNHGIVHVRNCRFGGEGGGFPAVCNFARFESRDILTEVSIADSYLYNAQDAAVVLKEVPNKLSVVNCSGLPDAVIVRVDPSLNLDTYLDKASVSIDIRNTRATWGEGLPEQLWPYRVGEIQAHAPPTKGNWRRGQFVRNLNAEGRWTLAGFEKAATPALDQPWGWLCTESGKPGTWAPVRFTSGEVLPPASLAR
jgi:hypothetical protein